MLRAELPVHRNRIVKRALFGLIRVLAVTGTFVFPGPHRSITISSHLRQSPEIGTEPLVSGRTVLEAFEISFQIRRGLGRKAINPPCSVASASDHSLLTEISEMLGNFGLRKAKDFLEVTDTKRTACQQMDDPQPGGIAETLVNRDQLHAPQYIHICVYMSIDTFGYVTLRCLGASIMKTLWNERADSSPVSAPTIR